MYPYPAPNTGYAWPVGNRAVHLMSLSVISDNFIGIIISEDMLSYQNLGLSRRAEGTSNVNYDYSSKTLGKLVCAHIVPQTFLYIACMFWVISLYFQLQM